jgi:hypothetical protein
MKTKSFLSATIVFTACSGAALFAQPDLAGPLSGYAFEAGVFRPIVGLPGSAYLGPGISKTARFAGIAPNGRSAISADENGVYFIADLGQADMAPLSDAVQPTGVFWARDSSAVALYSAETQSIQFSSALAPSPLLNPPVLLGALGVTRAPLAVDAGLGVAAVCANGELAVLAASGLLATGVSCDGLSVAAFAGENSLYAAGNGRVLEISNWKSGGETKILPADGISDPVAAAIWQTSEARLLLLVSASDWSLQVCQIGPAFEVARIELDFSPSSLDAFGQDAFLLNRDRKKSEPLLVFRARPQRAVIFIPAGE